MDFNVPNGQIKKVQKTPTDISVPIVSCQHTHTDLS